MPSIKHAPFPSEYSLKGFLLLNDNFDVWSGWAKVVAFSRLIILPRLELFYRSDLLFMDGEEFHSPVVSRSEEEGPEQNPICTGGLFYKYGGLKLCSSSHFSLEPPLVGRGGGVTKADSKDAAEEEDYETDEQSRADYSLAPYFPLNGPSYFILTLDKANPSLLKTRFHYVWNNNQVCLSYFLLVVIRQIFPVDFYSNLSGFSFD